MLRPPLISFSPVVKALTTAIPPRTLLTALSAGAAIGVLGGLIGLGGAEFRLPLLITVFGFIALEAVIVNKAISLIVVASALAFRSTTIPLGTAFDHGSIVINLLAGSLVGAWIGADLATRLATATVYRVIAVLLVLIALVLAFAHDPSSSAEPIAHGAALVALRLGTGFAIGVVAALLGVAGGELLIPTLARPAGRRHQARRKPLARCQPADHARRLRTLQPRPELRLCSARIARSC